jgi:prevent-host-death family protein
MSEYSLTEARANLPLLLHRAENGEDITITRHGRPVAVVVGHDRWMKTARYEVLEEARRLHDHMEELRKRPFSWDSLPVISDYDVEGHIAWLREDDDDPWEEVERERRERGES